MAPAAAAPAAAAALGAAAAGAAGAAAVNDATDPTSATGAVRVRARCRVDGCNSQSQGLRLENMCRKHFVASQRAASGAPQERGKRKEWIGAEGKPLDWAYALAWAFAQDLTTELEDAARTDPGIVAGLSEGGPERHDARKAWVRHCRSEVNLNKALGFVRDHLKKVVATGGSLSQRQLETAQELSSKTAEEPASEAVVAAAKAAVAALQGRGISMADATAAAAAAGVGSAPAAAPAEKKVEGLKQIV